MLVTPLGIAMLVRLLQPQKADSPMLVTLDGMIVFIHPTISVFVDVSIIALHSSRLSYTGFSAATLMLVKLLQSSNAASPMLVTLDGISTLVRLLQPKQASSPMLVTPLGISTFVRLLHS